MEEEVQDGRGERWGLTNRREKGVRRRGRLFISHPYVHEHIFEGFVKIAGL